MIFKAFNLDKLNFNKFKFYLLYGKNEGLQNEVIDKYFTLKFPGEISKYEESELINNSETIIGEILNKSLFSNEKILIISRTSDKIIGFINQLLEKNIDDIKIIIKSGVLEKKSKLRNLFEKSESLVCIPFYEDDGRNLLQIINKFANENNIKISRESINLIVDRANGNRENLNKELDKIFNYSLSNKTIGYEAIKKLTNLAENYGVNELVDQYLSKNTKNIAKILNENNYSEEDCILILRTLLIKSKRLLSIIEKNLSIQNIDAVILNSKPPIFWKEKESVKKQASTWKFKDLKDKIYQINDMENLVKTNPKNSLNIVSDFIINY